MAIKLITLRDFLSEVSGSISSASQRLSALPPQEEPGGEISYSRAACPLEIKSVKVSFSARVVNRKLTNTRPAKRDEILLDFVSDYDKRPNNIYGEMMFSGRGEPLEIAEPYEEYDRSGEIE